MNHGNSRQSLQTNIDKISEENIWKKLLLLKQLLYWIDDMNSSRVYIYHCTKYSRKRVFPDPHSRIFYAVHLISETVFQINETNEKKRFFDLKILSLINFVEPLKKDFNFLQIYCQLLKKIQNAERQKRVDDAVKHPWWIMFPKIVNS